MSNNHITATNFTSFEVFGEAKGQPRPRAFKMGDKIRMFDPGTAEYWKSQIAKAAQDCIPHTPIKGPVILTVIFLMKRPKAHFKPSGLLKDSAPLWCEKKPDIDNQAKAVMDCLTAIDMWDDDKQVCSINMMKRYTHDDERAGCRITIGKLL